MNTKSQLLQYPPFCFDYLIFGVYVVLIKYQGAWSPFGSELPQVVKHVDHVPYPPRRLFDFRREVNAGHGDDLETVLDEGLGVEEAVEQHLPGRHRHLRQAQQDAGRLDQLAAQDAQVQSPKLSSELHWQRMGKAGMKVTPVLQ